MASRLVTALRQNLVDQYRTRCQALRARNILAQGNALGPFHLLPTSPVGAQLCTIILAAITLIPIAQAAETENMAYTIKKIDHLPAIDAHFDAPAWQRAETLTIANFHPRGSGHKPKTQARLLHNGNTLAVIFRVEDQYVIARHTEFQQPTHEDSCVEFFAQPSPGKGYFNFEMSATGTLLLWYVEDARRINGEFAKTTPLPLDLYQKIDIHASLSGPIETEITDATTWTVSYQIPIALFEAFTPQLKTFSRQKWRGNFYKCADKSSHPHWGYWADIGDFLDFHQPEKFAPITFE